jgi:putative RNA 2'-phosphotransferase
MINEKHAKRISKFLSLVLRHAPDKIGLKLDSAGWVSVEELVRKMNSNGHSITFEILQEIVEANDKQRFGFNTDRSRIRANQGHSIEIEHGFESKIPPENLYHGTAESSVSSILKTGLIKRNRHHVHLSIDKETALKVGMRHGKPIILEIMSAKMQNDGYEFYLSENKVWLTEFVPSNYIVRNH